MVSKSKSRSSRRYKKGRYVGQTPCKVVGKARHRNASGNLNSHWVEFASKMRAQKGWTYKKSASAWKKRKCGSKVNKSRSKSGRKQGRHTKSKSKSGKRTRK